jgi:hypothetical protein
VDAKRDESGLSAQSDVHAIALDKLCDALRETNRLLAGLHSAILIFQDALAMMLRAQEEMNQMLASLSGDDGADEDPQVDLSGMPIRVP